MPKRCKRTDLGAVHAAVAEAMHVPDLGYVDLVLGAIAANRLPGDTVSVLLVGPPSSGKSEIIQACSSLPSSGRSRPSRFRGCSQSHRQLGARAAPEGCSRRSPRAVVTG